ncbi:CU044_5270 family protein [Streptomyces sp. N2-109]|uniref:CU044_5270 family protein n=1 Tax=Streptomyces gossypii TaxID=2883101 RepID=A0ABT2K2G1_9ACTN|nr:CU044_5270 family protein [Streptomyces gossypii]MCT2593824.1 CU044_5270 family protein [Streptomyces gossypii]
MDEITTVRELRDDAPVPDHARLSPGRQRLTDAMDHRSARLRVWGDWRITSVGAAAAVAAAVLVGTQLAGDAADTPAHPAASNVQQAPDLSDASALLLRAARTAAAQPDPKPRDGQWVYQQTVRGHETGPPPAPKRQESWTLYNDPQFEDWKEGDDHSHGERYEFLAALPEDAEGIFERAREFYPQDPKAPAKEPEALHNFGAATVLLGTYPAPPEGMAKVLRALAELDGMKAVDHLVKDAKGRPAVALFLESAFMYGMRDELLFDPETLRYVGGRTVATEDSDPGSEGPPMKKGDILINGLVSEAALVDKEGQRPPGVEKPEGGASGGLPLESFENMESEDGGSRGKRYVIPVDPEEGGTGRDTGTFKEPESLKEASPKEAEPYTSAEAVQPGERR